MKLLIILVLVSGLGVGGYFFWKDSAAKEAANRVPARPTTAEATERNIRFVITAAGDIGPADQVAVKPEINGRISELPVDIGDKVAKDALLCRLDDKDLQIERSQRRVEIDGAKLQLQKATRSFSRSKKLFTENLVSEEVFEDTRTEYDLATNALERAESALRLVEDRLSKTKILAPFDCTVLTRPVSIGQAVSGSAGFNSGSEIMTIANLNDMIITAHINQADVIRLTQGQDVSIQVESVPGLEMQGRLERVAPQAVIKNGIKGFAARVAVKSIDAQVRPGMTAILTIPIASADNVLAVPLAAVFTENGERYVFVKNEEGFDRRTVLIGLTDYAFAEVQKGLVTGDIVSLQQFNDPGSNEGAGGGARESKGASNSVSPSRTAGPAAGATQPAGQTGSRPKATGS